MVMLPDILVGPPPPTVRFSIPLIVLSSVVKPEKFNVRSLAPVMLDPKVGIVPVKIELPLKVIASLYV